MGNEAIKFDHSVDVVVVGTGSGAMTNAICNYEMGSKDVLMVEKTDMYGGSSSLSGGGVWIPCSHYAKEAGAEDSFEDALTYLKNTVKPEETSEEMLKTYLTNGPKMLRFMHDRTHMRFHSLEEYPDYYTEIEGSREGHRSMEPEPFDITQLENKGEQLRPTHPMMHMMDHIPFTQHEAHILVGQLKGWMWIGFSLAVQYFFDIPTRLRTNRSRWAKCGSGGTARLAMSVQDRKIPLWLNTEMTDLIIDDGKVVGIKVKKDGKEMNIEAKKAVVLAAGGFEGSQKMREKYLPQPTNAKWSAGNKGNTGLPIEKAAEAGAKLKGMDGAWWCTSYQIPGIEYPFLSIMEKSYPGSCVVNKHAKRVANESMNYQAYVQTCFEEKKKGVDVDDLWLIFGSEFRAKYICGPMMNSKMLPDKKLPKEFFNDEYLTIGETVEELAGKLGIPAETLRETTDNMTKYAKTGDDLEFKRGSFAYDRYYGDPDVGPNNCLAPMDKGPYYAVRLSLGDFGTNGGLEVNENAQVIKTDGSIMQGLFAIGNCSAPLLPSYPGPGSTLGPSMTFGYQAAKFVNNHSD